jgi:hypothetical protein
LQSFLQRALSSRCGVVDCAASVEAARPLTSDFRILGEYAECPNPVI